MKSLGFTPNQNYLFKRFVQILLLASIIGSATAIAGREIGHRINPTEGATWGLVISFSLNLAWVGLAGLLSHLHYRSLFYEIHTDKVILHAGVITKTVTHVPFQMITNLKVRRSPFDRFFNLGTIDIQTAGKGEHHGATGRLLGLRNFKEVYDNVTASMRQDRDSTFSLQEKETVHSSELVMLGILLEEMKSIRILLQNLDMHQRHLG